MAETIIPQNNINQSGISESSVKRWRTAFARSITNIQHWYYLSVSPNSIMAVLVNDVQGSLYMKLSNSPSANQYPSSTMVFSPTLAYGYTSDRNTPRLAMLYIDSSYNGYDMASGIQIEGNGVYLLANGKMSMGGGFAQILLLNNLPS